MDYVDLTVTSPDTVYEDQRSTEEDREKLTTGICTAAKKEEKKKPQRS